MTRRINVATGTPWEPLVGYARAMQSLRNVEVSRLISPEAIVSTE